MNHRITKEKRVFILQALCEGTPINATCRIFKTGKHAVLRLIQETGEALMDYMHNQFHDLRCERVAMDESWSYVHTHGARMASEYVEGRGDFWVWAAIDPDTKLLLSHRVDRRNTGAVTCFVADVASRITGPVQIVTDPYAAYKRPVRNSFDRDGVTYGTETKVFLDPDNPEVKRKRQNHGVADIVKVEREAVIGSPNMATLTTAHIERMFLTLRQELARLGRLTLAYSKSLDMHRAAIAMQIGIYNLVRKHTTLGGQTPAQAAGVEQKRWTMEDVVDMTERYWAPKYAEMAEKKALASRESEDRAFQVAMAVLEPLES